MTARRWTVIVIVTLAGVCFTLRPALAAELSPASGRSIPALGIDLRSGAWYASADLPPDASPETILQSSQETTPDVILRSAVAGGSGILFSFIELPPVLPPASAARVTIGDMDGEDEAFFNGENIGSTNGVGVTDAGRPRLYEVPSSLLRPGRNVLALRLRGHNGKRTFGVRPGPLTFALAPQQPEDTALPPLPERERTISRQDATQAISAVDSQVTAGTVLHEKRLSFGRFGELQHDGLPAVGEVSPTRIAQRNGATIDVALDRVTSTSLVVQDGEPGIDCWHKRTRVRAVCSGQQVQYTVLSSVLYPGAVITLEEGTVLQFRARFPSGAASVLPMPEETMASLSSGKSQRPIPAGYVFFEAAKNSSPIALFAAGLTVNVTQAENHVDITVARAGEGTAPGRVFLCYPKGVREWDLSAGAVDVRTLAAALNPAIDPAAELANWVRLALNEPVGANEFFRVLSQGDKVRVYQVTRYSPAMNVPPITFRPPQVDFAAQQLGYPIDGPETTATGLLTFSGEAHTQLDDTATSASPPRTHCTWYDLPVPPMHERGLLAVPVQRELRDFLNKWALSDLGSTASATGVDALYKSRTQAYQAFSHLTADKKHQLSASSAAVVPEALGENLWHRRTELFSGLEYWWTYYIEGPFFEHFDQDWGNGLSLYGLYHYVKYSGNWSFPTENWDAVERIFSWFSVTDDWEWMRASNGAHGHGTGAGDCASATYAATVAYGRLAEGCGRIEEQDYGTYLAARAAVFALNRFVYNNFASAHELKKEKSLVVGFHEGKGFLTGSLEGYPWDVTSNISGNGVQPVNFDLYLKYAVEPLRVYQQAFEKEFPNWMSGTFQYPQQTLYRNNSGYITLPHIYLRARLQETFATLRDLLEQAAPNDYLWWIAPPVIAEVLHLKTGGVYVRDWGRCAFEGGEVNRDENSDPKRTEVTLRVDVKHAPDLVEIVLPKKPVSFTVNDGPVPLTDSRFEDNVLQIRLRRAGSNKIAVTF